MGIFTSGRPKSKLPPPKESGWYRFRNTVTKSIENVGISNILRRRKNEHLSTGKLKPHHKFEYKVEKVPYKLLRLKEKLKIKQYKQPMMNKNSGGGGRTPAMNIKGPNSSYLALVKLISIGAIFLLNKFRK